MRVEFPVVSFACACLTLFPLPWFYKTGNVAAISISLWLFIANIINGINAIVWAGNVQIIAPVWCDIATKIIVGTYVAIPTSLFCLCAFLDRISSAGHDISYPPQKRRVQYLDFLLCFCVPLIYMVSHLVVQAQRFDIIEDIGCRANIYDSIPSILLVWVPPLTFLLAACVFSGLAFRNFWIHRIEFGIHLQTPSYSLTPSQYFRLMAMALTQCLWIIFVMSFNIWLTLKHGLRPWISWNNVHNNFSNVGIFPTAFLAQQELVYTYIRWWTIPVSSLLFFVFTLGQETMEVYGFGFSWLGHTCSWLQDLLLNILDRIPMLRTKQPSLPTHLEVEVSIAKSTDKLPSPLTPKFGRLKSEGVYPVPLYAYGSSIHSFASSEALHY